MRVTLKDFATANCASLNYLFPSWIYIFFEKYLGNDERIALCNNHRKLL